jgi:PAS domain S-box-containing protein
MLTDGAADQEVCHALGLTPVELLKILDELGKATEARPTHHGLVGRYERAMRIRAERRVRALTARFGALIDASPLAVFVVDGATGIIKQVNEYAAHLFGYEPESLIGASVENLVSPTMRTKHVGLRHGFLASVRRREMGYHPPIFAVRQDGSQIELSIALTATSFDDEVMVVCSDFVHTNDPERTSATVSGIMRSQ